MRPTVQEGEAETLKRLMRSLGVFKLLNDTMPLQYVLTFLAVATDEGKGVKDYADKMGVNNTTMSRHLLDLGPRNRKMEEGFGLVQYRASPLELRKHEYYITPKGRQLLTHLLKEMAH